MKRKSLYVLVALVFLLGFGCAGVTPQGPQQSKMLIAENILKISAVTYETCMKSAAELYVSGQINTEQKDKILKVAEGYWLAYHCAVDVLATYYKSQDKSNQEKVQIAIAEVSKALSKLVNYLKPYIEEETK